MAGSLRALPETPPHKSRDGRRDSETSRADVVGHARLSRPITRSRQQSKCVLVITHCGGSVSEHQPRKRVRACWTGSTPLSPPQKKQHRCCANKDFVPPLPYHRTWPGFRTPPPHRGGSPYRRRARLRKPMMQDRVEPSTHPRRS